MKKLNLLFMAFAGILMLDQNCARQPTFDADKNPHLQIAAALDRSGDLNNALKEIQMAKLNGENKEEIDNYLINIENRRIKAKTSLKDLNIGLKNIVQQHRYHRYYYQAGICYELLGQDDKALLYYTKSIGLRKQAIVFVQRAILFDKLDQRRAALLDLNKALEIDPDYPRALFHLGMNYVRDSKWIMAESIIGKLKNKQPYYASIILFSLKEMQKKTRAGVMQN